MNYACLLKCGGEYNEAHVRRLFYQVKRADPEYENFYVFTDSTEASELPGVVIPLEEGLSRWWGKLQILNRSDLGRVCYLDLDLNIPEPLDWLAEYPTNNGEFWAQEDEYQGKAVGNLCSSTMLWEGCHYTFGMQWAKTEIQKYERDKETGVPPFHADQGYIQYILASYKLFPLEIFANYPFNLDQRWVNAKIHFYPRIRPWHVKNHDWPNKEAEMDLYNHVWVPDKTGTPATIGWANS